MKRLTTSFISGNLQGYLQDKDIKFVHQMNLHVIRGLLWLTGVTKQLFPSLPNRVPSLSLQFGKPMTSLAKVTIGLPQCAWAVAILARDTIWFARGGSDIWLAPLHWWYLLGLRYTYFFVSRVAVCIHSEGTSYSS